MQSVSSVHCTQIVAVTLYGQVGKETRLHSRSQTFACHGQRQYSPYELASIDEDVLDDQIDKLGG